MRAARKTLKRALGIALLLAFSIALSAEAQLRRPGPRRLSPQLRGQIQALRDEKAARSPAERKLDSQLLFADRMRRGKPVARGIPKLRSSVKIDAAGTTAVEIRGRVTAAVLGKLQAIGATILYSSPRYHSIRARAPLARLTELAQLPDIRSIRRDLPPYTRKTNTSQGDIGHRAAALRASFGIDGSGITVGVLSDGVDTLAARQASGDLPSGVTVLPGQAGSGDEGTAMLEIVYDLAPGANLLFATAFNGMASFANNIVALQAASANVIIDDVGYLREGVFQDDIIAQAVNTVTAAGALYFSAAGNSGSLDHATASAWEGDWVTSGTNVNGSPAHDFGGGVIANVLTLDNNYFYSLQWSDPLGGSGNDYDLLVTDAAATTVLDASTFAQNGNADPIEYIDSTSFDHTGFALVIVQSSGNARFLQLNANGGRLTLSTDGQTSGHAAAVDAYSVAAVNQSRQPFDASDSVESFSSDGPRRIFYQADGTPITPADFSSTGGEVRLKPDITAADCVRTATPGFATFCGTSAAAPHAGAIAALLLQLGSSATAAEIRNALTGTAIDIEAPGWDRNSGAGIVDALAAGEALACGNGIFEGTEECDDGNKNNGDCCSSGCRFETTSIQCRAATGVCDLAEYCTGASGTCPADGVEPATTLCRASVGVCDAADFCDGVGGACPTDAKLSGECRPVAGVCDLAELCDGLTNDCPTDVLEPATTLCRASVGVCDAPDFCDGVGGACPADQVVPDGTSCADGLFCNGAETCGAGSCSASAGDPCLGGPTPICSESSATCVECLVDGDCPGASLCQSGVCYSPVPVTSAWPEVLLLCGILISGLSILTLRTADRGAR